MNIPSAKNCPETLRIAFLDLLTNTLLKIRSECDNPEVCLAFSDHMHNIPSLLAEYQEEKLVFYWEVERDCFINALSRINRIPPAMFEEPWNIIKTEYLKLSS